MPVLFTIITYWFSSWAFVITIPVCFFAKSTIFFLRSLFWSCFEFLCVCVNLCVGSFLISFSRFDISVTGMVFFLFLLSYAFCCNSSTSFGTFNCFSFRGLSRGFCR